MRLRLGIPRSKGEWILTIIGAATAIACTVPLARGCLSLSWPKVDGVITHSRSMSGLHIMGVDIGYSYATDGRTYTGDRFRFQSWMTKTGMEGRDVQSVLGRYRSGEPVRIALNPGNPSDSVLEPGPDFANLIPLGMGLFLLLLGIGKVQQDESVQGSATPPLAAGPRFLVAKILAAAAAGLFLFGAYNLYHGMISTQWPSVVGKVLYSSSRSGSSAETLLWYEYHVSNTRYLASTYRNGGNITAFDEVAIAAAKRYPAGGAVSVYYNPGNPSDALLEPGIWWGNYVAPAFALLLFGAAWIAKWYAQVMATRRSS